MIEEPISVTWHREPHPEQTACGMNMETVDLAQHNSVTWDRWHVDDEGVIHVGHWAYDANQDTLCPDCINAIPAEHRERANTIINEAMRRSEEAQGAPHPSGLSQYYRDRSGQPLPAWADQVHEWAMDGAGDWLGDYCVIGVEESDRERLGLRPDTRAVWIIGNAVDGLNVGQLDASEYALALSAMTKR